MNRGQKHKPGNNVMFDSNSPETNQQLDALEQRLRVTRPQPSRLDAAALMREADEQIVQHRTSVTQRSLWIAGSWVCGAAIGALVMFVLMSGRPVEAERGTAVEPRLPTTAWEGHLPEATHSTSPRFANEEARESGGSIPLLALDLLDDSRSGYLADGGTLQVGMYLRRRGGSEMQAVVRRNYQGLSDTARAVTPASSPSPIVTRARSTAGKAACAGRSSSANTSSARRPMAPSRPPKAS